MNEKDIFLNKIFRNSYIRKIIFKQIKQINKSLKYIRYNFYDAPLSLIINNKNEEMLIEKLKLHQIQRNNQFENNIINYEDYYNHFLDFNIQDYYKLLKWRNLKLETFKIYFNHFKNEILKQSVLSYSFRILVSENGVNVDILKFIIGGYNGGSYSFQIYQRLKFDIDFLLVYKPGIPKMLSLEMFNYLFKSKEETSEIFEIDITNINSILNILFVIMGKDNKFSSEEIIAFFNLIPDGVIKSFFYHSIDQSSWGIFMNQIIESNNMELCKLFLEKLQISKDDLQSYSKDQYIKLLGYIILYNEFKYLNINLKSFSLGDTMLPLFKELIQQNYGQFFTKNQRCGGIIEINGPDYSDYVLEKLKSKGIPLINQHVKFTYKCQRNLNECTSKQLSNNYSLLQTELMTADHFKCELLNKDIGLFDNYLSKFGFTSERYYQALELGYENMCIHILTKSDHLNYIGLYSESETSRFYYNLLLKSLPSDTNNGCPMIYQLLKPIIRTIISNAPPYRPSQYYQETQYIFEYVNNKSLPLNPVKRELFILKLNEVSFYENKSNYYYLKYKLPIDKNHEPVYTGTLIHEGLDFSKSMLVNFQGTNEERKFFFHRLFMDSIYTKSFKLMKNILKYNPDIQRAFSVLQNTINNCDFKSLFYLLINYNHFKLKPIEHLSSSNLTEFSIIIDFCKLPREREDCLNLLLGINEFKNFNFFYIITRGTTDNQFQDLQSADKYSFISKIIVASKFGKNKTYHLQTICDNSNYKCIHGPGYFEFIENLYGKVNPTYEFIYNAISVYLTLFNQGHITNLKLFGLYPFFKDKIKLKPLGYRNIKRGKKNDDNQLIDSLNNNLNFSLF